MKMKRGSFSVLICERCGKELKGNQSKWCSACGTDVAKEKRAAWSRRRPGVDDMDELVFETKYRLVYDFEEKASLDLAQTLLRGAGLYWYKIYKIEEA